MASSKKYGYQLRGEKLSLVELDVTGSGSGLNYTHTEGDGLDITTDPSAWKSPIETVTDGLQIEYLSNEFLLESSPSSAVILNNLLDTTQSTMNVIDWLTPLTADVYYHISLVDELLYPTILEQVAADVDTNFMGASPSNVLKVTTIEQADLTGTTIAVHGAFYSYPIELIEGNSYTITFDMKVNATTTAPTINTEYLPSFSMRSEDLSTTLSSLVFSGGPLGYDQSFEGEFIIYQAVPNWARYAITFVATTSESARIHFGLPPMGNNGLDSDTPTEFVYFDNMTFAQSDISEDVLNVDISSSELTLPSYAQKALLDYVRAQTAYEGGDLQQWDFFMKQFRSKLERWEDSRITGPRVLGPSSSAIR